MSDDKKSSNSTNENIKIFNGELFVNNNSNDLDSDPNNNFLRKSTSNSMEGGLSNNGNIRGSMKSNQSNGERFLTNSLMQDLRGSSKKDSDKKIELDKSKLKDQQNQLNITESSNNSNNNNEEDILANIKLPKNDINNQMKSGDEYDLYEDVENEDNEDNKFEMDVKEYNDINNENKNKNEEMNDIININRLAKLNEFYNKNKKKLGKNNLIKGNELDENLSLRSSGGSACISSHSNNSNSNGNMSMNMNMRSSKIFNKKEKNSPIKQNDKNNSSGNLIDLNELNINNENDINQNNSIDNNNNNNIIINEINDNSENKKENQENKDDKERKEKLAKIKDKNNEKNFISKNIINFENKNINNIYDEDKIELEMQLFNLDSFLPESIKEKEKTLKENYENDKIIIQSFQNIMQNFEISEPKTNLNIINQKKEENTIKEDEKKEIVKEEDKKELLKEEEKIVVKEMEKEEYVFEKFGKLGWECEKCNNFNFESRTICNRCEAPKQPKTLEQIKLENELKSGDKKKKPLIERKGDWQCPLCHNLNFAFRVSCNRCKLPKEMYLNYSMKQQKLTENLNNMNNINLQSNYVPNIPTTQIVNNTGPQLIQNQFNIYQFGYVPMYNPYFPQNHFNPIPQPNINNINNINNYKRKHKFYKQ